MLATIPSAVVDGIDGRSISVEVINTGTGTPRFTVVGLPDATIRESRDRVRAALLSSGCKWPSTLPLTVNLAPTNLKKHGAGLDLPLALGVLVASRQLEPAQVAAFGAVGELGLDGSVRAVPGLVSLAEAIGGNELLVPSCGAAEAAIVRPGRVRGVTDLRELVAGLRGDAPMPAVVDPPPTDAGPPVSPAELADVRGQPLARWALEVAAAGGHHLLMVGPPGAGKTMLSSRLAALLPPLDPADALVVARIHSVAGLRDPGSGLSRRAPFRAPHHGMSSVALIGGGSGTIRPGEISIAHAGVLFLDELGEFPTAVLEAMRQPLEEGVVRISRSHGSATLPARFQLIGATNPCPCGEGGAEGECRCSRHERSRYAKRLSSPLLDRFDLRVEVAAPDPAYLLGPSSEENTATVAQRVARARQMAAARGVRCNADLPAARLDEVAPLDASAMRCLEGALACGQLTGRGLRRIRTVARTIADLEGDRREINANDISAALVLRVRPSIIAGATA